MRSTVLFVLGFFGISGLMIALWFLAKKLRNATHVDVAWAYGLGFMAIFFAVFSHGNLIRRTCLIMPVLWSFRLGTYLLLNRSMAKHEDGRYQKLRQTWGASADKKFLGFFLFQGTLVSVFSLPFLWLSAEPTSVTWWALSLAILIWSVSITGESIADYQLAKFKSNRQNKGQTCNVGLWKYSRHPNYFFEFIHWWTYVALSIGTWFFLPSILFPLLMLLFLFKITGIPTTEARALETRPISYRRYQQTTNVFFPGKPKTN